MPAWTGADETRPKCGTAIRFHRTGQQSYLVANMHYSSRKGTNAEIDRLSLPVHRLKDEAVSSTFPEGSSLSLKAEGAASLPW